MMCKKIVSKAAWFKEFEEHYTRMIEMMSGPCTGKYTIGGVNNPCFKFNQASDELRHVRYLALTGLEAIVVNIPDETVP